MYLYCLSSFWRSSDLHIGISDSKGDIFSYSKFGLISDYQVDWKSCILIFKSSDFGIRNVDWDHILEFLVDSPLIWSAERYNESSYNCLDFVLTFVRILANSSFCKFNEKVETLKCLVDKICWENTPQYPYKMAEFFEDDQLDDKSIDYQNFKSVQFTIFKHNFREAATLADNEAKNNGFKQGFNAAKLLARNLGRLKGILLAIERSKDVIESTKAEAKKLKAASEELLNRLSDFEFSFPGKNFSSEFTVQFVKTFLPDFDAQDISCLGLGDFSVLHNNAEYDPISRMDQKNEYPYVNLEWGVKNIQRD
uniref:MKRN2 opposite strand protein-like C-terminal domain-containing protein n=1 Tax=Romanomermis culicivorax TaxID=13658 RepID=A0A915JFZ7_ROMCU